MSAIMTFCHRNSRPSKTLRVRSKASLGEMEDSSFQGLFGRSKTRISSNQWRREGLFYSAPGMAGSHVPGSQVMVVTSVLSPVRA